MGRAFKIVFGIILVLVGVYIYQSIPSASLDEVVGSWEYVRGPRKSCLDVYPDGKYELVIYLYNNEEKRTTSEWSKDKISDGENTITFDNFSHIADDGANIRHAGFWPVAPSRSLFKRELQLRLSDDEELYYRKIDKSCIRSSTSDK